jgi:hypothetical protein
VGQLDGTRRRGFSLRLDDRGGFILLRMGTTEKSSRRRPGRVCVCVCVTQREKKRIQKEREIQKIGKRRESERHTERETLSVLYFVCVGGSDLSAMQEFAMTLTHRVSFSP